MYLRSGEQRLAFVFESQLHYNVRFWPNDKKKKKKKTEKNERPHSFNNL